MFEAPNKESVYAEYMPDSVRVYGSESRLDAALPELAAQGLPVYDMKPELLKEADTYQNYLPEVTATTVDMNEDNSFAVFESDSPNDKTLLVVGDSFSQNLKYFMPKLYRKTVFATFDTYTEALLDEYQPDDFVYLTVERNQELFEDVETVVWRDEVPEKDG